MNLPFLVVGLPRSRTAWLAKFLTIGGRVCRHEPSLRWTGPDDFDRWLAGDEGASDSMMTFLAHETHRRRPDIPIVTIRRPRHEVMASLNRLPYKKEEWLPWWLEKMDARLDRIEDELGCPSIPFDQLDSLVVITGLFNYCLGVRGMPLAWFEEMRKENVQADIAETKRLIEANRPGWTAVYKGHTEDA